MNAHCEPQTANRGGAREHGLHYRRCGPAGASRERCSAAVRRFPWLRRDTGRAAAAVTPRPVGRRLCDLPAPNGGAETRRMRTRRTVGIIESWAPRTWTAAQARACGAPAPRRRRPGVRNGSSQVATRPHPPKRRRPLRHASRHRSQRHRAASLANRRNPGDWRRATVVCLRPPPGGLKVVATILEQSVVEIVLTRLDLQCRAASRAPARGRALQAARPQCRHVPRFERPVAPGRGDRPARPLPRWASVGATCPQGRRWRWPSTTSQSPRRLGRRCATGTSSRNPEAAHRTLASRPGRCKNRGFSFGSSPTTGRDRMPSLRPALRPL